MKKRLLSVTMAVFMFLGLTVTAMAEEAKPETPNLKQPSPRPPNRRP